MDEHFDDALIDLPSVFSDLSGARKILYQMLTQQDLG